MLERARHAPVSIFYVSRYDHQDANVDAVTDTDTDTDTGADTVADAGDSSFLPIFSTCASRAAHLNLSRLSRSFLVQLLDSLSEPAHQLVHLSLNWQKSADTLVEIPPYFLSDVAPKLSHLSLSFMHLPWTSHLYQPAIVTLQLSGFRFPTSPDELDEMLSALEHMLRLRNIQLDIARQPQENNELKLVYYQRPRTVSFPSAMCLFVAGSFEKICTLLSCFITQQRTSLCVTIDNEVPEERTGEFTEAVRKILQLHLNLRLPGDSPPSLQSVFLAAGDVINMRNRIIMASSTRPPPDQPVYIPHTPRRALGHNFDCKNCGFVSESPSCPDDFMVCVDGPFHEDSLHIDSPLSVLPMDLSTVESLFLSLYILRDAYLSDPNWYRSLATRCYNLRNVPLPRPRSFEDVPQKFMTLYRDCPALRKDPGRVWKLYRSICRTREFMTIDTARSHFSLQHEDLPSWAIDVLAYEKAEEQYNLMDRCLDQSINDPYSLLFEFDG